MISASRGAAAPSRHRRASSLGEEVVGGFFSDFEAVRAQSRPRCSAQVWDLYRIGTWAKSGHGEKKLLIVHHVLSILVWPLASLYRVAGPFLLHYEYTELSSPFLQLRWVTQLFFGRGSRADKIMSMLFALSFFIVRSTNVHVVLHAAFYSRQYSLALHPELPLHVRLIGAVTAGLPALLNLFWTLQILKMGKKMLFPKPRKAK